MCLQQVIVNSEVWDLRTRQLLRSVPALDQAYVRFNAVGDVILASLRRSGDELLSALHGRRRKHALFAAVRTIDAVTYDEIATFPVDRCVLDAAMDGIDSQMSVLVMDAEGDADTAVRLYDIGRQRGMEDDSDIEDGEGSEMNSSESEDEDEEEMDMMFQGMLARETGEGVEEEDGGREGDEEEEEGWHSDGNGSEEEMMEMMLGSSEELDSLDESDDGEEESWNFDENVSSASE